MKNITSALIPFAFLVLIALLLHHFLGKRYCDHCQFTSQQYLNETQGKIKGDGISGHEPSGFTLTDMDGNILSRFSQGFVTSQNSGTVVTPPKMKRIQRFIRKHLRKNKNQELLLSGKYNDSEGEKFGLMRANNLKDVLVKYGIDENKIITKGLKSDFTYNKDNKYYNGIAMLFQDPSKDGAVKADEMKSDGGEMVDGNDNSKIADRMFNKTLYSDFNSVTFKHDPGLRKYTSDLLNYLAKNPNKKISITGHGDSLGSEEINYRFGKDRAKYVAKYLISKKIAKEKIKTYSKGETQPVATNSTANGRSLNRRTNIKIE